MDDYVEVEFAGILAETEKAFLMDFDGDDLWIPKSIIKDASGLEKGQGPGTIEVEEWYVKKNGIDYRT